MNAAKMSATAPAAPVIGVDLGGTKIAVAALRGTICSASIIEPTVTSDGAALLDQITRMVGEARDRNLAGETLAGIGLGVPSVIEFASGRVISSVNIPLRDVPLRSVLSDRLGDLPVFVDNDATVAAYAEAHDEGLQIVAHNLVMLTIGTGVGGGVVLDGRIFRGATGAAAELGHTLIALGRNDRVAPAGSHFPQPSSLERAAAGHSLDRIAEESAEAHPKSVLGGLRAVHGHVTGADAVAAARGGDKVATALLERWAEWVGVGIANAITTFDPDEVVIGGGAAAAGEFLLGPAERVARSYLLPGLGTRATIRVARHGSAAGVLGAALLARHELETVQIR